MVCYINMKEVLNHFEFPVLLLKFGWELIKGLGEFLQFIFQGKKTLLQMPYNRKSICGRRPPTSTRDCNTLGAEKAS